MNDAPESAKVRARLHKVQRHEWTSLQSKRVVSILTTVRALQQSVTASDAAIGYDDADYEHEELTE